MVYGERNRMEGGNGREGESGGGIALKIGITSKV